MKLPFENLLNRLKDVKKILSVSSKNTFVKTDKQLSYILITTFAVSAVALFCYWFFKEKPYYDNLLAEKEELIKSLKFTRDKQKKNL
ncbi:MAG: hypothetical protein AYP45_18350 [Candidatus Brocadia carolinensis]|uniref:Uncharacterized protein n=1 Tax=Candidatus Brocadia carolinensis TaxID=1004156 RepID=A0A1V4ANY3_9BACT|nr:MAG: hypothetical protein AYP45_18350 [Candidatus Brocadia caroliniensis]